MILTIYWCVGVQLMVFFWWFGARFFLDSTFLRRGIGILRGNWIRILDNRGPKPTIIQLRSKDLSKLTWLAGNSPFPIQYRKYTFSHSWWMFNLLCFFWAGRVRFKPSFFREFLSLKDETPQCPGVDETFSACIHTMDTPPNMAPKIGLVSQASIFRDDLLLSGWVGCFFVDKKI